MKYFFQVDDLKDTLKYFYLSKKNGAKFEHGENELECLTPGTDFYSILTWNYIKIQTPVFSLTM